MARTVRLTQSNQHVDLPRNTQVVDTNRMGGCITVILVTHARVRAQHCAGGILAITDDFWDIADGSSRAMIVGVPTGYDQDRIDDMIEDSAAPHVVHLEYSRAKVHIPLLATSRSELQTRMSAVSC